jgi:hypothetical protein
MGIEARRPLIPAVRCTALPDFRQSRAPVVSRPVRCSFALDTRGPPGVKTCPDQIVPATGSPGGGHPLFSHVSSTLKTRYSRIPLTALVRARMFRNRNAINENRNSDSETSTTTDSGLGYCVRQISQVRLPHQFVHRGHESDFDFFIIAAGHFSLCGATEAEADVERMTPGAFMPMNEPRRCGATACRTLGGTIRRRGYLRWATGSMRYVRMKNNVENPRTFTVSRYPAGLRS